MHIQYRYQRITSTFSVQQPWKNGNTIAWTEWLDWPLEILGTGAAQRFQHKALQIMDMVGAMETRVVNAEGNVLNPSPPWTPAYYQRKTRHGRPGGLAWMTSPPSNAEWIRRDDVKPA
jgi:hypothetical protein